MNAHFQTLQDLCLKNPALGRLLQFDVVNSQEIATMDSANIHFSILYHKPEDNYLVHYRCHNYRPAWEDSPEGYVRCSQFDEVLEALNEEIQAYHLSHGKAAASAVQHYLWLGLQPKKIASEFRFLFTKALDEAMSLSAEMKMPPRLASHIEHWTVFLHRLALSA